MCETLCFLSGASARLLASSVSVSLITSPPYPLDTCLVLNILGERSIYLVKYLVLLSVYLVEKVISQINESGAWEAGCSFEVRIHTRTALCWM